METSWTAALSLFILILGISSVQLLSGLQLFVTPWITAHQASLSITNSRSLLKPMPIESVMPSSHLILCRPLLLQPPIPPSIRVFSNESTLCMRWPKYYSFSFSISPSNEHSGLISFRMDWLDLLAVPGTLKSLLQHHSSKASIFRCSAFFTVQLSHKAHLLVMSLPNSEAMIYQEVGCFGCPVQAFRQEQEVKTDSGVRGTTKKRRSLGPFIAGAKSPNASIVFENITLSHNMILMP